MLFSLSLGLERRAYAYVDPGSGLLMLQAAGTILTGVLFTLRRRIKILITRKQAGGNPGRRDHELKVGILAFSNHYDAS